MTRPNERGPLNQTLDYVRTPQQPATWPCARLWWLPMEVAFSAPAVPNEQLTSYTKALDFDYMCRGAWSNLTAADVQFTQLGPDITWSWPFRVNIQSWTGNDAKVFNMRWWRRPNLLRAQETIKGDFSNTGSEDPGDVVFMGEVYGADLGYQVRRSASFDLFIDLGGTQAPATTPISYDLLIHGALTNVDDTDIVAKVIDERNGWPWSSVRIPVVSFAGLDTAINPIMWYHKPYLLRANNKLTIDINTQTDGNYLVFLCEKVIEGNLT